MKQFFSLVASSALLLGACAKFPNLGKPPPDKEEVDIVILDGVERTEPLESEPKIEFQRNQSSSLGDKQVEQKQFVPPNELDKALDAKPISLGKVKPVKGTGELPEFLKSSAPAALPDTSQATVSYQVQLAAIDNIDEAQRKKAELEGRLGVGIQMLFDAPFYKLRFGNFESRQEAQEKVLELTEYNIQGFVVKR